MPPSPRGQPTFETLSSGGATNVPSRRGGAPPPPTSFLTVRSSLCRVSAPVGQDGRPAGQPRAGARARGRPPAAPTPRAPSPAGPEAMAGRAAFRIPGGCCGDSRSLGSRAAAAVGRGRARVTSGPVTRAAPPPGNTLPGLPGSAAQRSSQPSAHSHACTSSAPPPNEPPPFCPTPVPHTPVCGAGKESMFIQCLLCGRLEERAGDGGAHSPNLSFLIFKTGI